MTATLAASLFVNPSGIAGIAFEVTWKAALLCVAIFVLHIVAGRRRVLLRSVLWHLCLVGLALLPASIATLPRWHVVTQWADPQDQPRASGVVEPTSRGDADNLGQGSENDLTTLNRDATERFGNDPSSAPFRTHGIEESNSSPIIHAPAAPSFHFDEMAAVALVVYVLTLSVLLIRLVASLSAVAALRAQSTPVANSAWLEALGRWHAQFGVTLPVEVRQAELVSVPVVVGWRRPTILLPPALAETTDRQAIDAVLLHELTHVARGDYSWNLLLRIVSAFYWPHPCVWIVGLMVRRIREEICDAVCVRWLGDVRAYCGILVDVAAGRVRRSDVALGMAMSRSSKLGRRIAHVENSPGLGRGLLGRPWRIAVAAIVLGAACFLGSVQIAAQVLAEKSSPGDDKPAKPAPANQSNSRIDPPTQNQEIVAVQDPNESKRQSVVVVKVQRGKFERITVQPATLVASGQIAVHARIAGIVSKATVDIGDQIKAGDVLAELDVPDLEAELADKEAATAQAEADEERAKAAVQLAKAAVEASTAELSQAKAEADRASATEQFKKKQYERMQELYNTKSISQQILDEKHEQHMASQAESRTAIAKIQAVMAGATRSKIEVTLAEAGLRSAGLRVTAAKADLARSQANKTSNFRLIRSPIDGVVLDKNVEVGMFVKPADGKALFRIAALGVITAEVALPQREALLVKRDNRATVEFDALEDRRVISGKVSRVAYVIDPLTRTLHVEIALPNAESRLKPGMFGRATIVLEEIPNVVSVPISALSEFKGDRATCVRIVDGQTVPTPVKLGPNNGERIVIVEGLSEGDVIVAQAKKAPPEDSQIHR